MNQHTFTPPQLSPKRNLWFSSEPTCVGLSSPPLPCHSKQQTPRCLVATFCPHTRRKRCSVAPVVVLHLVDIFHNLGPAAAWWGPDRQLMKVRETIPKTVVFRCWQQAAGCGKCGETAAVMMSGEKRGEGFVLCFLSSETGGKTRLQWSGHVHSSSA